MYLSIFIGRKAPNVLATSTGKTLPDVNPVLVFVSFSNLS